VSVGGLGGLLIDLIPELAQLIGPQPPVAVLSAAEARLRFQSVLHRFIGAFARPEHPLVIFIDDLQWLDPATLGFADYLVTHPETRHLLLIGAYRDNEVGRGHPLARMFEAIRQAGAKTDEIALAPLSVDDVDQLLSDALRRDRAEVRPLAELVRRKTGGNPFFAGQFLTSLAEEGLLEFDTRRRVWTWDLEGIGAKGFTDNVVDLMIGRLRRLPSASQEALKLLACLGNQADFSTLAMVIGGSEDGMLLPSDIVVANLAMHASFRSAVLAEAVFSQEGSYRFLHDRVREAAYALIPPDSRAQLHLRVGRLLVRGMTEEKVAEKIFDVVNQLNFGATPVSDWVEKEHLAALNLRAGKKAKASAAHVSASGYFAAGMAVLAEEGWQRCYDLALGLRLERAECELLSSNLDETERLVDEVLAKGRSKIDRAEAYRLRMLLQLMQAQNAPAIRTALECLRMFGLDLPERPTPEQVQGEYAELRRELGERPIESLVDLPLMSDPQIGVVMKVLATLGHAAYATDHDLFQVLACRMVRLALEHGNSDFSPIGYGALSIYLGPVLHRFADGERFARLAVAVAERYGFAAQKAGAYLLMQMAVLWTRPIAEALTCLEAVTRSARESGEVIYACISLNHRLIDRFARGDTLDQIWAESAPVLDFARRTKFRQVVDIVTSFRPFVQSLRGRMADGPPFDEAAIEAQVLQGGIPVAICYHWILQLQRQFLLGDPERALEFAAKAEPVLWSARCHIQSSDYCLYQSLALAAVFSTAPPERQAALRTAVAANLQSFERWAESCPATFSHKRAVVAAELARIEGRDMEAMRLYEQATRSAADHGFVQHQAIANELAARFYFACGLQRMAHTCLRDARDGYARWGAHAKVAQLDQRYPEIEPRPSSSLPTTIEADVEHLDLATALKMSQAIAVEIVFEKLIETLMGIAVEHAGADRGLLVLAEGDQRRIEAEATSDRETVRVRLIGAPVRTSDLPASILHHVLRTQDFVIIDDARRSGLYSADEYLRQKRVRSVLCLPLVKQAELIGVLYLENSLAPHVFTPARTAVLKLLSSPAAISLQNARLYSRLISENRDRQRAQEALRASETSLNEAQRISHTGSWRWNVGTGEVSSSAELLRIFAFDPATQPSYAAFIERTHPEDRASVERGLERAIREERRFQFECRIVLPDGSIKHLQGVGQPDSEEDGAVCFVGTVMDITERRRAEDALRSTQAELARVTRLTTMGELVASIAHEINQPLAAISTNAGAALNWLNREEPDVDEAREAAARIEDDARRASGVLHGLRALVMKSEPRLRPFDINDAIREVLVITRSEMHRQGVVLHTDLSTESRQVLGDRVQLQQVLLNLIMNGAEAMNAVDDRTKVLAISSRAAERDAVCVTVEDTGTGLAPDTAGRIFEPFFTTKPKGMGMGLSICRSIVEAHGGHLSASPRLPHGTLFQFTVRRSVHDGRSSETAIE
jgi:predicted ATPase/signal transduction histidine kinase/GAF domain-containing protein